MSTVNKNGRHKKKNANENKMTHQWALGWMKKREGLGVNCINGIAELVSKRTF